ncbi:hypothetical protein RINTHH_2610 [Richelia intracellularis HH01]|uniref:Uncharacterized protein n=1 Tax=Richelia intracellularis HH01 TaxID=1165094 RepID=M1X4M7_9NOST|nr:hypothetical protein RINTHH_2610 [Richelia intracellularis HH01]
MIIIEVFRNRASIIFISAAKSIVGGFTCCVLDNATKKIPRIAIILI